jgi:putative SOS response-associated peptidase YedK
MRSIGHTRNKLGSNGLDISAGKTGGQRIFPRYNVVPTTRVPINRPADVGVLGLGIARLGLIPDWGKEGKMPCHGFNARSECAGWRPTSAPRLVDVISNGKLRDLPLPNTPNAISAFA